ncbi:MAG: regulatory protein RecX [Corallincola sp.]|nr:regulatory protein RecX [Corallincola sp.]
MRLLARRDYSRVELQQRLRQRGYPDIAIEQALSECEQRGWQDDARFAGQFVRNRYQQGYGPLRIAAELRQRGVAAALINALLEDDELDWSEALRRLFQRRCKTAATERKERYKQARALQQRGFDSEQIRQLLDL